MGEMTTDDSFSPEYIDETKYTYTFRTGRKANISIDELKNGGRVGVHLYSKDGKRMSYYRFRINNIDTRKLVAQGDEKDTEIPDEVAIALHAGGWQIENMASDRIAADEADPVEVQMLDIRNGFQRYADQSDIGVIEEYFTAMARAVEIGLVMDFSFRMADAQGMPSGEAIEEVVDNHPQREIAEQMSTKDHVEGWIINAVRPETQRSTDNHDRIIDGMEYAYQQYQQGAEFGEAFAERMGEAFMGDADYESM